MANQIVHVIADGWEGVYINERLAYQDHRINFKQIMPILLHIVFDSYECVFVDQEWIDNRGSLPMSLDCVVFEKE